MVYYSRDKIDRYTTHGPTYPLEVLNSFMPNGFPPYELFIKMKMPVIILRNINKKLGICNGTRAIVTGMKPNTIRVFIITGRSAGTTTTLFRIKFKTNGRDNIAMTRLQFPIKPCFAMTINKSQGQTLEVVGVNLEQNAFSHGQLYVALSRVRDPDNLYVYCGESLRHTKNIVYFEVLEPD